jgi:hypothetical protein
MIDAAAGVLFGVGGLWAAVWALTGDPGWFRHL